MSCSSHSLGPNNLIELNFAKNFLGCWCNWVSQRFFFGFFKNCCDLWLRYGFIFSNLQFSRYSARLYRVTSSMLLHSGWNLIMVIDIAEGISWLDPKCRSGRNLVWPVGRKLLAQVTIFGFFNLFTSFNNCKLFTKWSVAPESSRNRTCALLPTVRHWLWEAYRDECIRKQFMRELDTLPMSNHLSDFWNYFLFTKISS